jgi:hypothetical protein
MVVTRLSVDERATSNHLRTNDTVDRLEIYLCIGQNIPSSIFDKNMHHI